LKKNVEPLMWFRINVCYSSTNFNPLRGYYFYKCDLFSFPHIKIKCNRVEAFKLRIETKEINL